MKPAALWVAAIAIGALAPFLFYPVFVMKILCFALLAGSFSYLLGQSGLLSFGHAAFFGIGSYVTGYVLRDLHFDTELAVLTGAVAACVLGVAAGAIAIRRQGIYFSMITLALAQLVYFFCVQAPFTGGEDGLQNIPRGRLLGISLTPDLGAYFFVLAVVLACFGLLHRIHDSPFGHVLRAVRDNEQRARSLGFDIYSYKLRAFVISATFAGVAGALKAVAFQVVTLGDVAWSVSGEVVIMTLVGGVGTFLGPIVGSFLILILESVLASRGLPVQLFLGFVFMACVVFARHGVVDIANRLVGRVKGKKEA